MELHHHVPAEFDPGICQRCDMPKSHRSHDGGRVADAGPPPPRMTPTAAVALDASAPSVQAAAVAACKSESVKWRIVRLLARIPPIEGMTDAELVQHLGSPSTTRPRRIDLARAGLLAHVVGEDGRPVVRRPVGAPGEPGQAWTLAPGFRAAYEAERGVARAA